MASLDFPEASAQNNVDYHLNSFSSSTTESESRPETELEGKEASPATANNLSVGVVLAARDGSSRALLSFDGVETGLSSRPIESSYAQSEPENATLESINLSSLVREAEATLAPQATAELLPVTALADTLQNVSLLNDSSKERPNFCMGDHVYQWCSLARIPAVYQHHGIVMDVVQRKEEWLLQIADFSNWIPDEDDEKGKNDDDASTQSIKTKKKSLRSSRDSNGAGCIRTYHAQAAEENAVWHKVEYQAASWKQHLWRSGTCTSATCDAPAMVRARVQFLLEHADLLPPYSMVQSNCECVAVWCKTGTWATLQAAAWLSVTAAGQAKSAATLAGVAAGTQVTTPAQGMWGWLGYTTHASLATTQPHLIPAIAAYGVVTVGAPALLLLTARKKWKDLTVRLNESFWESAVDHPDIFVENITHWSGQHDPEESCVAR